MATIPRTYKLTTVDKLSTIDPKNGQIIATRDSDGVWYDAPDANGNPVRRKISGVKVISILPDSPMEDILYVYIGNHGTSENPEYLPGTEQLLYTLQIWSNNEWLIVGSNKDDINVKSEVTDGKYYLVGSDLAAETVGSLVKNSKVYVTAENGKEVLYAERFAGSVDYADNAENATQAEKATKATNDNTNQPITRYVASVSKTAISTGTRLTFTKGDGTTLPYIDVPDTTYEVFAPSTDGLVPGPTATASSPLNEQILFADGWKDKDDVQIGTADKAYKDGNGDNIRGTYIKELSYDTTTDILTVTKGDGTPNPIPIPNTEYPVYSGQNVAGLVPPTTNLTYFLRGDGQWIEITNTTYTVFTPSSDGLVPKPGSITGKYLKDNGGWDVPTDTKNTVGSTQDNSVLYLVGTPSQASYAQSYSNSKAYINNGILYSNSLQVVDVGQPEPAFDVTAAYSVGDKCRYDGVQYECIEAISATPTDDYSGIESYAVDDTCVYDNVIYKCIEAISYPTASDYSETASYSVGDLCFYDDDTYRCNTPIDYSGVSNYNTASSYVEGDRCIYDGHVYQCAENTPSPAGDFDEEYWVVISEFDETCWDLISAFDPNKWEAFVEFDPDKWDSMPAQELYNKRYEGFKLGSACAAKLVGTVDSSNNVPTCSAVSDAIDNTLTDLDLDLDSKLDKYAVVELYNPEKVGGYTVGDVCIYDDSMYVCIAPQPQGSFIIADWSETTIVDYIDTKANGTVTTDSSFTASSSLSSSTITSKKLGSHNYFITIDATNGGAAITAGANIATSTATFNKVYATGMVGTTLALFTLNGHNLTCEVEIPASATIKLSINALA